MGNKITYQLNGDIKEDNLSIPFDSDVFKSILNSNKDMSKGNLKLSNKGMIKLTFNSDDIESVYYIARNE